MNRTVELSAGSFAYTDTGTGRPIVLLHALGRSSADWQDVVARLSEQFRCLALDLRGHGASVHTKSYSYDELVGDVEEFVDVLGLDRHVIVAHSVGAVVGWLYAARDPDAIVALVAEDTAPPRAGDEYPDVPANPPEPVAYDWEFRRQIFRELADPDPRWWALRNLVAPPILVVAGERDDHYLAEAVAPLPNARLEEIPVGHWIHEQRPDGFVDLVLSFLDTVAD